jgi:hypothetical protein
MWWAQYRAPGFGAAALQNPLAALSKTGRKVRRAM